MLIDVIANRIAATVPAERENSAQHKTGRSQQVQSV
jgi:hypothetical protein